MIAGNFHRPVHRDGVCCFIVGISSLLLELGGYFWIWCLFNFRTFVSSYLNANFKHEGLERCSKYSIHGWISLNIRPVATSQAALFATRIIFFSSYRESEAAISPWRVVSERGHYMLIVHVPDASRGNDPIATCSRTLRKDSGRALAGLIHTPDCRLCFRR